MNRIGQGGTATFIDATVSNGAGVLVNADTPPLIDILDANGIQLVTDVVAENTGVGLYRYPAPGYAVPVNGAIGRWKAHWTTVINGVAVLDDDYFEVVAAGSIGFPPASASWVAGSSLTTDKRLTDANMPPDVSFDMCTEAATAILIKRSGGRYGIRSTVLRPNHHGGCACWPATTEIELPGPVVDDVLIITIDGVILSTDFYRLYDHHTLVRTDGRVWPACAHLASPTATDWSIALNYGLPPGPDAILACRELAIHIALGQSGKISKIPARATSVSTRGLSINLLRGERFGIPIVDDWLDAVNPENLRGRPSVMSPDTIRLSDTGAG